MRVYTFHIITCLNNENNSCFLAFSRGKNYLLKDLWKICYYSSCIFAGFYDRNVQENVAIHGEQKAFSIRVNVRRGNPKSFGGKLRLPDGVDHARLHRPERL